MDHVAVDEIRGEERGRDPRATLDEDLEYASGTEIVEQTFEVGVPLLTGMDPGPSGGVAENDPMGIGALDHAGGEFGIIGADRARSDHDGLAVGANPMDLGAGLDAGDPPARSVRRRGRTVEGGGEFDHHEGTAGASVVQIRPQRLLGLGGGDALDHGDPGPSQCLDAPSGHLGIGILEREDHRGDSGLDQGVDTGRCATVMTTGFECDEHRRSPGVGPGRSGGVESDPFGMAVSGGFGRAVERATIGGQDHTAHPGIGRGAGPGCGSEFEGARHPSFVATFGDLGHGVDSTLGVVAVLDPRGTDDIDPDRFEVHTVDLDGVRLGYVREGVGGIPVVLVHGWPETKRIFWRVIAPLAEAGFDVVVPDLRGFGDSSPGEDGFGDVPTHARDLFALVHDHLGLDEVVVCGGDLGGPIIQDLALRHPDWVERMVLFNSPLPYLADAMAGLDATRSPVEVTDYYVRQGRDADGLLGDLVSDRARRAYVATFYTSRLWAHPGHFTDPLVVDFHTEPFGDEISLRASLRAYEAVYDPTARSEPSMWGRNEVTPTMVLYGPSDHVVPAAFDQMAEAVFARCVGPFLIRDCGHFVPWEAPRVLISALTAWCRDHR